MENNNVQIVGNPIGLHGPYTFYKAFKFTKNGSERIMTLGEFFFVKLWLDTELVCIGELQLLWNDKNSEQVLASLRLYFLPENTPEGRTDHGEDEVLAISEKVVLKIEDLVTWVTIDTEWTWGKLALYGENHKSQPSCSNNNNQEIEASSQLKENSIDFTDVEKEKKILDCNKFTNEPAVLILSYPKYCRYRAVMKRIEGVENEYLRKSVVYALGGVRVKSRQTRILFCKDTFDYPELEGHELLCNHLAPKLKGRPRGKRKVRSASPESESNESECSVSNLFFSGKIKNMSRGQRDFLDNDPSSSRSTRRSATATSTVTSESKDFLKKLYAFMKENKTPIGKIPSVGFKPLDLTLFYNKVQMLGGYDAVTTNRLWNSVFSEISDNQSSTSAATVIRRHYERFLLPYERFEKGEEHKPLPVSERRRLKSRAESSNSVSDAESVGATSSSGSTTPAIQSSQSFNFEKVSKKLSPEKIPIEAKEEKSEPKPSSLRSVRVKPARSRQKEPDASNNKPATVKPSNTDIITVDTEEQENPTPIVPTTNETSPAILIKPEKSTSPDEGKENIPENIPVCNSTVSENQTVPEEKPVVEVPLKSILPEIELKTNIVLNNNIEVVVNNNFQKKSPVFDIKKGKLDILKEGGLEVTPVKNTSPVKIEDIKLEDPLLFPTPSMKTLPITKNTVQIKKIPSSSNLSSKQVYSQTSIFFGGIIPQKIGQSESIYLPPRRVIYPDPKLEVKNQMASIDSSITSVILDLRTSKKSDLDSEAPIIEIEKVIPNKLIETCKDFAKEKSLPPAYSLPMFDSRILNGSLQITMVGGDKPKETKLSPPSKAPKRNIHEVATTNKAFKRDDNKRSHQVKLPKNHAENVHHRNHHDNHVRNHHDSNRNQHDNNRNHHNNNRTPHNNQQEKNRIPQNTIRSHLENSRNLHDNNRNHHDIRNHLENNRNHLDNGRNQQDNNNRNQYVNSNRNQVEPNYNERMNYPGMNSNGVKYPFMAPPQSFPNYFPMIDPSMYYQALQGFYGPQLSLNPPIMPSQEHMKYYAQLMSQQLRIPHPFQLQQENNTTITLANNTVKKP